MLRKFFNFLTNNKTLAILGFVALLIALVLAFNGLDIAAAWAAIIVFVAILVWAMVKLYKRWRKKKESDGLNAMLEQQAISTTSSDGKSGKSDIFYIRQRMLDAIGTIKTSKLGMMSGKAALYELPWYMIIGNPAAGKSTAIMQSGLKFPLADKNKGKVISGVGGTRNCDWFFTTDGIFLDTAGRYAVHEEDKKEWFGFLKLLKKHRKLAPINGIIIAVSIPELLTNKPEFGIDLAKNLRQRVQELTERLEIFAPVYIVFTKADMIPGFNDFFESVSDLEKTRVWGATKPYNIQHTGQDVLNFFDERFDELYDGLKEMSLASMALHREDKTSPGIFTFPLEFMSTKPAFRSFIATLFEDNPFQFKPIFRGFYFTSALQEDNTLNTSLGNVADQFHIISEAPLPAARKDTQNYFLLDLFRKVICADKSLVTQYASKSKNRLRYAMFFVAALSLGLMLGGWSWSYIANKQLVADVQADLDKVIALQENKVDLQSRFESLEVLQKRIEQLAIYRDDHPITLGLGLYQGEVLERKLRDEYFAGVRDIMLKPISSNIETFLSDVNRVDMLAKQAALQAGVTDQDAAQRQFVSQHASTYKDGDAGNLEDAYNALKTYLMLGNKDRAEAGHLNDQIARFWRTWLEANRGNMSRDQMISTAERIIGFYIAQKEDIAWPTIETKPALIDQARTVLVQAKKGMPAQDRIYSEVKARANTRYQAITVAGVLDEKDRALITGSYAIPGVFTREAWENYIAKAFKEAANNDMQTTDWVLRTSSNTDLTLVGSPEQIEKALIAQYKKEYVTAWQKFMQGINVANFSDIRVATERINRLGDGQNSPINTLLMKVFEQTSWDNPTLADAGMENAKRGFVEWFKQVILRRNPTRISVNTSTDTTVTKPSDMPLGDVGKEFTSVAKIVTSKDNNLSLLDGYLTELARLRGRLNQMQVQGDHGPSAKQLMEQTLNGNGSELSATLKFVDEQMLVGMSDTQKAALRPVLVRPLMQTFEVMINPTAAEVNKIWQAQVYQPYQTILANKYPFNKNASIEAGNTEIAQIFGSEGAISKFFSNSVSALVVRRGNTITAKSWADMGLSMTQDVLVNLNTWVAPLSSSGITSGKTNATKWVFQMKPQPAPGTREYVLEIDGQVIRYRNTQAQWVTMSWPSASGASGAKLSATTFDGQTTEIVNFPGEYGFKRLIDSAQNKRNADGYYDLTWQKGSTAITLGLKIISKPGEVSNQVSNGVPSALILPPVVVQANKVIASQSSTPQPDQPINSAAVDANREEY